MAISRTVVQIYAIKHTSAYASRKVNLHKLPPAKLYKTAQVSNTSANVFDNTKKQDLRFSSESPSFMSTIDQYRKPINSKIVLTGSC